MVSVFVVLSLQKLRKMISHLTILITLVTLIVFSTGIMFGVEAYAQSDEYCNDGCKDIDFVEEMEFDHTALFNIEETADDPATKSSLMSLVAGDNRKVTLRHEIAYMQTPSIDTIETNRSSARLEWDKLLTENVYVTFDGKANVYWPVDRRAKALGEGYLTRYPIRELFLQASKGDLSVSLGRQVVIWGESEIAAVVDIISPRNISDFYFTSLDESRIGQNMVSLDYYSRFGRWNLLYVNNPEVNEDPILDGDYDIDGLRVGDFTIAGHNPDLNPEYGVRWKQSIGKGDFSILAADVASNDAFYGIKEDSNNSAFRVKQYPRYRFIGGAANIVVGDSSVSMEVAYKKNMPYQSTDNVTGLARRNTGEVAFSINHNVSSTHSVYLGASNVHVIKDVSTLENADRDSNDLAIGWNGSFKHEIISASYDYQHQFQDETSIHTASLSYAATSNLFYTIDIFLLSADDEEKFSFFQQNSVLFTLEYIF